MSYNIVHCSIDERGKASGGVAGDQTNRETCVRSFYVKPWGTCIRYKDSALAAKAVEIATKLANSNLVGYDQSQRNTLYQALKKHKFNVDSYIASGVKTEADCSSFVYAVWSCLLPELRSDSNAPTTSTANKFYEKFDFKVLSDTKYLTSGDYNKPGDLLNAAGHHIVMFASVGSKSQDKSQNPNNTTGTTNKSKPRVASSYPNLRFGSKGEQVKLLQRDLNYISDSNLSVDGEFGKLTEKALKEFQAKYKLTVDGIYGAKSQSKLNIILSEAK